MSCRCERAGWLGHGHDQGCPYDGDKTPWFEETIQDLQKKLTDVRADRDAKQKGFDDLHQLLDPITERTDVWSQVDTLIKRLALAEKKLMLASATVEAAERQHQAGHAMQAIRFDSREFARCKAAWLRATDETEAAAHAYYEEGKVS